MKLSTRTQSQRDSQWGSIILGYNDPNAKDQYGHPYNLYWYACLITSLANYLDKRPDEINEILKSKSGYQAGGGLFVWSKSTVLGIIETYVSPRCQAIPLYATEVTKLREFIKQGYPALCEVDFNPSTNDEEMHFVLAVGFTDTEIIVVDPWEGQLESWSDAAFQRNTYQYRVYDKKLSTDGGTTSVAVDGKVFENLVRKSTIYDKTVQKLGVEDNETIILSELDKLIGYEDAVVQKDHQLADANTKVIDLENKIKTLVASHEEFAAKSTKTIQDQGNEIETLSKSLQELKNQIKTPVYKGWKAALINFIQKI